MAVFTSKELFMAQAPSFNFDLSEEQILAKALVAGFVTEIGDDRYLVNENYPEASGFIYEAANGMKISQSEKDTFSVWHMGEIAKVFDTEKKALDYIATF
tara:strand:- start:1128 stop:1427 length:300 start_codon:yes stop_codon:yes gene_type:complete